MEFKNEENNEFDSIVRDSERKTTDVFTIQDDIVAIISIIEKLWNESNVVGLIELFNQFTRDVSEKHINTPFTERILETNFLPIIDAMLKDSANRYNVVSCIDFLNSLVFCDSNYTILYLENGLLEDFIQIFNENLLSINRICTLFNNMIKDTDKIIEHLANSLNFRQIIEYSTTYPKADISGCEQLLSNYRLTPIGQKFVFACGSYLSEPQNYINHINFIAYVIGEFCDIDEFHEFCQQNNFFNILMDFVVKNAVDLSISQINAILRILSSIYSPEIYRIEIPVLENLIILKNYVFPYILFMFGKCIDADNESASQFTTGFIAFLIDEIGNSENYKSKEIAVFICTIGTYCHIEMLDVIIDSDFLTIAIEIFPSEEAMSSIILFYMRAFDRLIATDRLEFLMQIVDENSFTDYLEPMLESTDEEIAGKSQALHSFILSKIEEFSSQQ